MYGDMVKERQREERGVWGKEQRRKKEKTKSMEWKKKERK